MNSEISTLVAAVAAMGGAIAASLAFIDKRVASAMKPLQDQISELETRIKVLEDARTEAHSHVLKAHTLSVKGGHDDITGHLINALEALT